MDRRCDKTTEIRGYTVFVRDWWIRDPSAPDGRRPGPGKKWVLARGLTLEEAREMCIEYSKTHRPGKLSKKAEFTNDMERRRNEKSNMGRF